MTVASSSLGVPGYTFADLHDPERLSSLYERFCEEVAGGRSRRSGASGTPTGARPTRRGRRWRSRTCSSAMAPHVSRFVTRLFDVDAPAAALAQTTRDQDDLFRFKVDFVRRRALPLLKGGAHVVVDAGRRCGRRGVDRGRVDPAIASSRSPGPDARCWIAEKADYPAPSPQPSTNRGAEALVRRAAPRSRLSRLGDLPVSRERRLLAPRRGRASRAAAARSDDRPRLAPAPARRLQADRRADEAARGAERDSLLRPLPRARQGLVLEGAARQGRQGRRQPARHRARRLPARREDLRDAPAAQGRRCRSARWRSSSSTTRCARAPATASATTA